MSQDNEFFRALQQQSTRQLNLFLELKELLKLQEIVNEIKDVKNEIIQLGEKLMSELSDLQAKVDKAVADAKQAFLDAAAQIDKLAASITDQTDLPALKADLATQADGLEAAASAMEAKINPPAPTV